jgi:hypothetical protein
LTTWQEIQLTASNFFPRLSRNPLPRKTLKRLPPAQAPSPSLKADFAMAAAEKLRESQEAIVFAKTLKEGLGRLSDEQCRLLVDMIGNGKELRVVAKKAANLWGDQFDGATAEVAGPIVYRELLRRLEQFDTFYNPEPAVSLMAEYAGYQIWFETPSCIYVVSGNGIREVFAPKFMPITGMDVEDAAHALDIIRRLSPVTG